MNKDNKSTEYDNTDKKLHISDVIKRSLIEEWKGIRILGCGRYKINREERAKMQKRYLELNRILLSEYN
jgi:hypothetical protein